MLFTTSFFKAAGFSLEETAQPQGNGFIVVFIQIQCQRALKTCIDQRGKVRAQIHIAFLGIW